MPRKSPPITITEISGDRFPDLFTAQSTARSGLVIDISETIRVMLAAGVLVQRDGQIVPNLKR